MSKLAQRSARIVGGLMAAAFLACTLGAPAQATPINKYPISGFFINAKTTDALNVDKLKAIKAVGGDTVITFGNTLRPATINSAGQLVTGDKVNPNFNDCKINGSSCVTAVTAGYKINRAFTFENYSRISGTAIKCAKDKSFVNNGQSYTLLLIPTIDNGCTSSNNAYDLVATYGGSVTNADPALSVAAAATSLGMKFYVGLPAPAKDTFTPWLPDMSYSATLQKFTERFVMFHASRNDVAGLAGFYHHTEMPMTPSAHYDPILDVYRMQNAAIKKYMPSREALVSPYIDARIGKGALTPDQARDAAKKIADTNSGIHLSIAIQDGMGTSKGAAYMGNEAGLIVDPFAKAYVGSGTWGSKYVAPVSEYFKAAAEGIRGTGASLWSNLEGMAPTNDKTANNCDNQLRGKTTKSRLDRQVQAVGTTTSKNISFMWDNYFICAVTPGSNTLAQDLTARGNEPIISDTTLSASGQIIVSGYNLSGAKVSVKYLNQDRKAETKSASIEWIDVTFGARTGLDKRMERASFNIGSVSIPAGSYYMVNVTNSTGASNSSFYSKLY